MTISTDIVSRLRTPATYFGIHGHEDHGLFDEAADLIQSQQALIEEMREALDTAKSTIKAWHGENAWEIYDRSSPEMVVINSVLSKALSQRNR